MCKAGFLPLGPWALLDGHVVHGHAGRCLWASQFGSWKQGCFQVNQLWGTWLLHWWPHDLGSASKLPPTPAEVHEEERLRCLFSCHTGTGGLRQLGEVLATMGGGFPSGNVPPVPLHPQAPLPTQHLWASLSEEQPGPEFLFAQGLV